MTRLTVTLAVVLCGTACDNEAQERAQAAIDREAREAERREAAMAKEAKEQAALLAQIHKDLAALTAEREAQEKALKDLDAKLNATKDDDERSRLISEKQKLEKEIAENEEKQTLSKSGGAARAAHPPAGGDPSKRPLLNLGDGSEPLDGI